ncbi:hypothetical protein LWI28_017866 [Acer negundo]|uniref:Uncharacterized protein n=1 Tax=Acer negundo TaxID=4023 RepID=A0AAD5IZX8_ACENE|nr:hypothetical protein LWI28_017866 [Acer negundo]
MPAFLKKAMHQNLYNVHWIASDSANIKDKIEEVDNKFSEAAKPDGHALKINECADKKDKPEEVDNKDSDAPKQDEHAPKVDEFEVAVEISSSQLDGPDSGTKFNYLGKSARQLSKKRFKNWEEAEERKISEHALDQSREEEEAKVSKTRTDP